MKGGKSSERNQTKRPKEKFRMTARSEEKTRSYMTNPACVNALKKCYKEQKLWTVGKGQYQKRNTPIYTTFWANPAKTGGLIIVILISFLKFFFVSNLIKRYLISWTYFAIKKKITRKIKVYEDINIECSNPDHWIQEKILPVVNYKNSSIRQLFQVL